MKDLKESRMASGSLGQGLSVSIGAALTKKLNNDPNLVFIHGDGELQEGQVWEALMYASANKIDNLIVTIDYNKKQIDGSIDNVLSIGDISKKLQAFDWLVLEEKNGNNITSVINIVELAISKTKNQKPIVILLHIQKWVMV